MTQEPKLTLGVDFSREDVEAVKLVKRIGRKHKYGYKVDMYYHASALKESGMDFVKLYMRFIKMNKQIVSDVWQGHDVKQFMIIKPGPCFDQVAGITNP